MGLESGTYVNDLVTTNPTGGDVRSQGDDHLRLLKSVLKNTFPDSSRAFYFGTVATKTGAYSVLAADQNSVILANATGGAFTVTLPAVSGLADGWQVTVVRINSGSNDVTVDGNGADTVNGAANSALTEQYQAETYVVAGSEFKIVSEANGPSITLPSTVSQAEAEAGTSTTNRLWTATRVKQAIVALESATPATPIFTEAFTSSEQNITAGGLLTLAHGLSAAPTLFQARLICKTAEGNYSVDDEVILNSGGNDPGIAASRGLSVVPDGTNIVIRYGGSSTGFNLFDKSTGNVFTITNSRWKLIVRAWQ